MVTLDLLGHGRSDRPADPLVYSMSAFAEQVVGAARPPRRREGGRRRHCRSAPTSSLEVAATWPRTGARPDPRDAGARQRAARPAIVAFVPLLFAARYLPWTVARCGGDAGRCRAGSCRSGPASPSTPSTSGPRRWPPSSTGSSSAGSRRRPSSAGRSSRRRPWSSATRTTRSTRRRRRDARRGDAERHVRRGPQHPRVALPPRAARRRAAEFALACWAHGRARRRTRARRRLTGAMQPGQNAPGAPLPRRGGRAAHPQAG